MLNYPIGVQDFEKIRKGGYVYVDKTALIYKLARGSVYFLGRPRRFGKSLLVSTLKYYFEGRRDLFEGLKIAELEQEWKKHPVFVFDFNLGNKKVPNGLRDYLLSVISKGEEDYGIEPLMKPDGSAPSLDAPMRFAHLVEKVHEKTGQQAVALVDEYDKPLLDLLETGNPADEAQLEANREELKNFFSTFKAADAHLRFVLLTGITKFSQVSMFSGVNQPDDISIDARFEALCGVTEQELYTVFADSIAELAEDRASTVEEMKDELKQQYDGYHFSKKLTDIYNPFSLLKCFAKNDINDYWFASGTPSFLMRLLSKCSEDVMLYTGRYYDEDTFVNYKADTAKPLPMIYQSGYLTIKECKTYDFDVVYTLGFPNAEVRKGFAECLFRHVTARQMDTRQSSTLQLAYFDFRETNDLATFIEAIKTFFASVPYQWAWDNQNEHHYHALLYTLLVAFGADVRAEEPTAKGRSDITLKMPKGIYVMELKYDKPVQEALDQIDLKGYAEKYRLDGRPVTKIGLCFSSEERNISDWQAVPL